jgi:hypothetical protein
MRVLVIDVRRQFAEHRTRPRVGEQQAEHHLDGRALARAVGPQQAEDLVRQDLTGPVASTANTRGLIQKSLKTLVRPRVSITGCVAVVTIGDSEKRNHR